MSFASLRLIALSLLALPACAANTSGSDSEGQSTTVVEALAGAPNQCAILCIAPPPGCEYKGGVYMGPCDAVHCGHLQCNSPNNECPIIDCAAPPDGCHYENMVLSPCNKQTCGNLVCDGATL
jgi:hypothetical protein